MRMQDYKKLPVPRLFEIASNLAVKGDYKGKETIYRKIILKRPDASDIDRFRVEVDRLDMIRRNGNPRRALRALKKFAVPKSPQARAEYLFALTFCYLMLGNPKKALKKARSLYKVSDDSSIPPDKKIYYLEVLLYTKAEAEHIDEEFSRLMKKYAHSLNTLPIERLHKDRAQAMYYDLKGRAKEYLGQHGKAADFFLQSFRAASAARNKAAAALQYLYSSLQTRYGRLNTTEREMYRYLKKHKKNLMETDIWDLKEKYDYVKHRAP